MQKLRCEATERWRGEKDPLGTGVAFTGQQWNTCFCSSSGLSGPAKAEETMKVDVDNWMLYLYI